MPNRILREGILSSERITLLSPLAELFYRKLMSVVDDYGRFEAHPGLLRTACWPRNVDSVSDADVSQWLAECGQLTAERGEAPGNDRQLVTVYDSDGKKYLQVNDFNQRLRNVKSKYPAPAVICPSIDGEARSYDGVFPPRSESESESESESDCAVGDVVVVGAIDNSAAVSDPAPRSNHLEKMAGEELIAKTLAMFGSYRGPKGHGSGGAPVVCDEDLLRSLRRKAQAYGMNQFQVAALFQRKHLECVRKPSIWPEGKGWFIHILEEAGKNGNGRPH